MWLKRANLPIFIEYSKYGSDLAPDHFIDNPGVGLDNPYDICGDVLIDVVGHGNAVLD